MPNGKRPTVRSRTLPAVLSWFLATLLFAAPALAGETLTLSSSSQVFEAFRGGSLDSFEKDNNVSVKVDVVTSEAALSRLSNGVSEIAATARPLAYRLRSMGYTEIPFCKDNFSVLVQVQTTVTSLSLTQLQDVFTGKVRNWTELGGPDRPIVVVTPAKDSAAYQNFQAMIGVGEIFYDVMTAESTMVVDIIRRIPWSITFVAQGATKGKPAGSREVTINGKAPGDAGYPFFQTYYLVTKGKPEGLVGRFIEYAKGPEVSRFIRERGMTPIY